MATIAFDGNNAAQLHTCLLAKTFFRFPWDQASNNYHLLNELSSDKDDDSEEEAEVIWQVQALCCLQHIVQAQTSTCNVCLVASASTSASAPTSTPTHQAPAAQFNCLRPGRTFDLLKSVPPKPWSTDWTPTLGCYAGMITTWQPKIEQTYMLAEGENHGLHLSGPSLAALVDKFKENLGNAV